MALIHGGDIEGYVREYGHAPLDFSANCNPLGIPRGVVEAIARRALTADKYPDPLCRALREALGAFLSLPPEYILCGNGAADIIFRLATALSPRRAVVTAPTFAEYALALETTGCEIHHHPLLPERGFELEESILPALSGADVVFICNPNNPTGRTVEPELMDKILRACHESGALLVVDECFNGFLEDPAAHSLKSHLKDFSNLLILDAFTKLYGMAGVRLGYCLTSNAGLLEKLRGAGQPWAVSSLAQEAGIAALKETEYIRRSRALIKEERAYLIGALRQAGMIDPYGEANYIFFRSDVTDLTARMRRQGMLIRDCGNYVGLSAGYYRVAVRTHEENEALIAALHKALAEPAS
ncbi:MAG TPA: aminotransferase class I/II-fold pyridoxal phosphate-dependent enzyme [Papillibacter sp.]|jgi:threonine-phosphate decarboxylase|nr:aminotransferase class I/II-fold pyridoxal phosphate-dependent enzyme [Papillibacter sp.]